MITTENKASELFPGSSAFAGLSLVLLSYRFTQSESHARGDLGYSCLDAPTVQSKYVASMETSSRACPTLRARFRGETGLMVGSCLCSSVEE